jgi:hypothetical protein
MWRDRDEAETRLNALVADFLDSQEAESGEVEIDLGVIAFVTELRTRRTADDLEYVLGQRTRPEAGYTPEAEWSTSIWYRSTDLREWVNTGLFRTAMLVAEGAFDDEEEADDESE